MNTRFNAPVEDSKVCTGEPEPCGECEDCKAYAAWATEPPPPTKRGVRVHPWIEHMAVYGVG